MARNNNKKRNSNQADSPRNNANYNKPRDNRGKENQYQNRKPAEMTGAYSGRPVMSPDNDYEWYTLNPQLLKDAASFPYAWPLGNKLDIGRYGLTINNGSVPGVMAINWIPTVGYVTDGTSPINVASVNVYTKVRHDNSGHANYDHADYMMYLMAMDSVYAYHSWMRRIYGIMLTFSSTNRYYPMGLIKAMGVDFNNIQSNLANFRAYINTYAIKAAALAIPDTMSIMKKHYWMSKGVYYDSLQDKPQTYLFNPLGFYKFNVANDDTPRGQLIFSPLYGITSLVDHTVPKCIGDMESSEYLTLENIIAYGDDLLSPIIADEDFGIMSGDTLKSFGESHVWTLPITEETYTVLPSYSEEVLDEIQNATLVGKPVTSSLLIDQDPTINKGWIKASPKFVHPYRSPDPTSEVPGQNAYLVDRFVTFDHGEIEPKHTMEATRLTNIANPMNTDGTYTVPTLSTETACCANIIYYYNGELTVRPDLYVSMNCDVAVNHWDSTSTTVTNTSLDSTATFITQRVARQLGEFNALVQSISVFNRHPAIYLSGYMYLSITYDKLSSGSVTGDGFTFSPINGVLMDVNYYTILSQRDLEEVTYAALLSEFDVTVR